MSAYLFRKQALAMTLACVSLTTSSLFGGAYVGVFGGGGSTSKADVSQRGFAFNNPDPRLALSVDADGETGNLGAAIGGAHVGYEFPTGTRITPALEFEGFYLQATSGKETSAITNPTTVIAEHDFINTLPLRAALFYGDLLFAFEMPKKLSWLEPYVAGGIGGGTVWLHKARSEQMNPPEPGLNHFNSRPSASSGAFTAQFKGGLRFNVTDHWRLFGEYRYVYIASTNYTFGFTQYPEVGHAPTSNWLFDMNSLNYNLGVAGIEYRF
ncbi:MAG: outer membrane protein [Chlamydiales bacterium]